NKPPEKISADCHFPLSGSVVYSSSPLLSWNTQYYLPGDPDGGQGDYIKKYILWLSTSEDFSVKLTFETSNTWYVIPPTTLQENTIYWRWVYGIDSEDAFDSTILATKPTIIVDAIPEPPLTVTQLIPIDGYISTDTAKPSLKWTASYDPDPNPTFTYTLRVSTISSTTNFWDYETGIKYSSYTPTENLQEDTTYWWFIVTTDNTGLSSTSTVRHFMINTDNNFPPEPFNLISPATGTVLFTSKPTLSWEASFDIEPGGSIDKYYVYYSSSDTTGGSCENIKISTTQTTVTVQEDLQEDTTYYWKVQAWDVAFPPGKAQLSRETTTWYFVVDAINVLPSTPILISPQNDIFISTTNPTFKWNPSYDPDSYSSITYTLYYSTDPAFTVSCSTVVQYLTVSSYTPTLPLTDNKKYYWKVEAIDNKSAVQSSTETFKFYVDVAPEPPNTFNLLSPADKSTTDYLKVYFDWDDTTDPDPLDDIRYTIYYSTDSNFPVNITVSSAGLTLSNYTTEKALQNNSTYYWKVLAKSTSTVRGGMRGETWSAQTNWYFYTGNIPPTTFELLSPSDRIIISHPTINFSWQASYDPELSPIEYTIFYSTDSNFPPNITISSTGITSTAPIITYGTSTTNLIENALYYWRVIASDNWNNQTLSNDTSTFHLNLVNEPPKSFELISPVNNSVVTVPNFSWQPTSDPDPSDAVRYTLYYSTDKTFNFKKEIPSLTTTNYFLAEPLSGKATYYWKVKAQGINAPADTFTWSNSIYSFFTPAKTPKEPLEVKVSLNTDGTEATLTWQAVVENTDGTDCDNLYGYRIYRARTIDALKEQEAFLTEVSSATLSYIDKTIQRKSFYYIVKAINQFMVESENIEAVFADATLSEPYKVFISKDRDVNISLPQDLYSELSLGPTFTVNINRLPNEEFSSDGIYRVYELKISTITEFSKELIVNFNYANILSDNPYISPQELFVGYYNGIEWIRFSPERDTTDKLLKIKTKTLSKFRIERISGITEFRILPPWPPKNKIKTPTSMGDPNDRLEIFYENPERANIYGKVYAIRGNFVADMKPEEGPPARIIWDCKDNNGYLVLPGVYIYQIKVEGPKSKAINGTVVVAR
ncbi:MAG: hypothetical protein QME68_02865, partial [Elusimicrobiota bacterium]|nr:hypothetical protein [Elusimicrobiota bacterium]